MDSVEVTNEVKTRFSFDQIQAAMQYLRDIGLDRSDSIVVIHRAYGISPYESKSLVHHSTAWASDRTAVEKLHEQLRQELDGSN